MDRGGSKKGSGGIASSGIEASKRRERQRQLASDVLSANDDKHLLKHASGRFECQLCLTIHTSESAYLTHTMGRVHKFNIAKAERSARSIDSTQPMQASKGAKSYVRIGKPAHWLVKIKDPESNARGILLKVNLSQLSLSAQPHYRFMSAYEQRVEKPRPQFQFLVIAAEPYNSIAFRIPSQPIDRSSIWTYFDPDAKTYYLQFLWGADAKLT